MLTLQSESYPRSTRKTVLGFYNADRTYMKNILWTHMKTHHPCEYFIQVDQLELRSLNALLKAVAAQEAFEQVQLMVQANTPVCFISFCLKKGWCMLISTISWNRLAFPCVSHTFFGKVPTFGVNMTKALDLLPSTPAASSVQVAPFHCYRCPNRQWTIKQLQFQSDMFKSSLNHWWYIYIYLHL